MELSELVAAAKVERDTNIKSDAIRGMHCETKALDALTDAMSQRLPPHQWDEFDSLCDSLCPDEAGTLDLAIEVLSSNHSG